MNKSVVISARIPEGMKNRLDSVCKKYKRGKTINDYITRALTLYFQKHWR